VDNSGLTDDRNYESRGIADRPISEVDERFSPTKQQGQMSPGGNLPSVVIKGLNIKGESRIAYEEAVSAAQTEAQSALSQDKVPRAYQNAVKGYFDDLKKE
jgi:hypothetical protein